MKKILKFTFVCMFTFLLASSLIACGGKKENSDKKECSVSEKIELSSAVLGEVEFDNADTVKLEQDCENIVISGTVEAMSPSQKSAYGVEDVTHVAVVKFTFDKERTLSSFKIKGNTTKVYSESNTDENYVGSLTDLLDSGTGEDAYTYLILSANTKDYTLTAKYSDDSESVIKVKITATLANATAE